MAALVTAGTVRFGTPVNPGNGFKAYPFDWTSHTDGTVSISLGTSFNGALCRVVTKPSASAAPTDNYDLVLTDDDGCDLLGGAGADRDATATEQIMPTLGTTTAPAAVSSGIRLDITNSGNTKQGTVILYFR